MEYLKNNKTEKIIGFFSVAFYISIVLIGFIQPNFFNSDKPKTMIIKIEKSGTLPIGYTVVYYKKAKAKSVSEEPDAHLVTSDNTLAMSLKGNQVFKKGEFYEIKISREGRTYTVQDIEKLSTK